MQRVLIALISTCVIWSVGVKPFMAEMKYFKFCNTLEEGQLLNALKYDPLSSQYNMAAAQFYFKQKKFIFAEEYADIAIYQHNGDLTLWAACFAGGLISAARGDLYKAKHEFEEALYYNPNFEPARKCLIDLDNL